MGPGIGFIVEKKADADFSRTGLRFLSENLQALTD
jgi:hypothetical protein